MRIVVGLLCSAALLVAATPAAADISTDGVAVTPQVTGFANQNGLGPIGIAFDQNGTLWATDWIDGFLYRFDGPGTADPSHRVGAAPLNAAGLAFDGQGRLYAARKQAKDIVEVNPKDGSIVRTVVTGLACPIAPAIDPLSGSLFVSLGCGTDHFVARIPNPASSNAAFEKYTLGSTTADGLTVTSDGTIYTVVTGGDMYRIEGPGSPNARQKTVIAHVPAADGVALGGGTPGRPALAMVVRTDGLITEVGLTGPQPTYKDVMTGGSRGDLAAVGPDGCLYATQTDSILRVTLPDGSCTALGGGLDATTPPAETTRSSQSDLPAAAGCVDRRKFTFKLHHGPRTTVTSVHVFVNGALRVRKRGKDIQTVTLGALPQKTFRVRVVSTHSNGSRIVSTRTYKGCKKGKPKSRGRRGSR